MSIDRETYEFYQSEAPFYSFNPAIGHSRHLDAFLDRLTPGARMLELGCGTGRDSARIAHRGFDLDATDGVPAMVAKTKERHGIDARLMRFDQLAANAEYEAVWAHTCLLHCPQAELPGVLAAVYRALRPGGLHYASYKLGDGEGRDGLGRLHNFPSADWLHDAYRGAQFEWVVEEIFAGKGSDGIERDWIALTVRRGN